MGSGLFRFCWLICLLASSWAASARATEGVAGDRLAVCIRSARPGLDPAALIRRPAGFDCARSQLDWGPGDYLVLSEPIRTPQHWRARVRTAGAWQRRTTLYALYADGALYRERFDSRGAARRMQLGGIIEHRLPVRRAPLARLLWDVEGSANLRGVVLDPRLATPQESARAGYMLGGFYGAFGGICLALLLSNLAMWAAMRQRFQLVYCGMLAALLVYAAAVSGALVWVWPALGDTGRLRVDFVALAVAAASSIAFARSYFEPRVFRGWLGHATDFVSWGVIVAAALLATFAFDAPTLLNRVHLAFFVALVSLTVPILWRAWREQSRYRWLFGFGWAAPVALASLQLAHVYGLIGWTFWLANTTSIAMIAEALLSSFAVAYRIHLLGRERDQARRLADTDPLTGLLNRRAFLHKAVGRTGAQQLLLVDIDHFKLVNDTVGHDTGDDVLHAVACALAAAAPRDALVARIGGEEFAVVTSLDDAADPAAVLEALRAARMPFDLEVTSSIGVAHGPLAGETDWKTLYRDADRALLEAKRSGRDRVRRALPIAA